MDDGPEQHPLSMHKMKKTIMAGIGPPIYDLVLTHGPNGEYTRHRRHEEVSQAVYELVKSGKLHCRELWQFAYEDGGGQYLPRADKQASCLISLSENIWKRKHKIITKIYGFAPKSWESRTTPRTEAFHRIDI